MAKMHGHHELPSEADCDTCGTAVAPVRRHNFHPQTGTVTCDDCHETEHSYSKFRRDWE
jgi:Zn finger protein HypA/HybF involved in hydrogenase expression